MHRCRLSLFGFISSRALVRSTALIGLAALAVTPWQSGTTRAVSDSVLADESISTQVDSRSRPTPAAKANNPATANPPSAAPSSRKNPEPTTAGPSLPWSQSVRQYPGQITIDPSFPSRAFSSLPAAASPVNTTTGSESPQEAAGTGTVTTRAVAASPRTTVAPTNPLDPQAGWPFPQSLLHSLQQLPSHPELLAWSRAVEDELVRLSATSDPCAATAKAQIARLQSLVNQAGRLQELLVDDEARGQFWRVAYKVARQAAVWKSLCELDVVSSKVDRQPTNHDLQVLAERRSAVLARIAAQEHSAAWNRFLKLDDAQRFPLDPAEITDSQRLLAYQMLSRLDSPNLAEPQQQYLQEATFLNWRESLRRFAQQSVDVSQMLRSLERLELDGSEVDSHELARAIQTLQWSPRTQEQQLVEPLSDHYRNANLRVAIAGDLINRLLHDTTSVDEPVDDVIRNARVRGQSHTNARVRVELLPDRRQWRLGLEARGDVAATTESRKGPATFLQDAWSNFSARKQLTVDRRGVRSETAEANARSTSDLRGFSTDFDHVPLFGLMARAVARNQYRDEVHAAQSEVEQRVADRARQRLDEEVTQRLSDAEGEFHRKWLVPLQRLGLEPTAVDMETTQTRLIVRYRLASGEQLAAHTARPQAPANSWLSVQIHQSAVNNTLAQLAFEGRRLTIPELYQELTTRFDRPAPSLPDDLPDDISVQFADREAVRVRCDEQRLTIEIRIAELAQGTKNRWKNFIVKAHYVPLIDQRDATLVRDGIIEISGEKRSLGNQVVLRTVFAKVLSKNRPISLINEQLVKTPQLADLEVNQFVLLDGWLGVALAPKLETARAPESSPVETLTR